MREVAGKGRSRHLVGGGSCGLVKLQGNYLVALIYEGASREEVTGSGAAPVLK